MLKGFQTTQLTVLQEMEEPYVFFIIVNIVTLDDLVSELIALVFVLVLSIQLGCCIIYV